MDEKAVKLDILGSVTGVGFRFTVSRYINQHTGLSGYVRNIVSGRVELFIQGKENEIEHVLNWIKGSPGMSRVMDLKINEMPYDDNYKFFTIR